MIFLTKARTVGSALLCMAAASCGTVENIYAVINYSGTNSTAYHGYWGRDFKKPDPRYGTLPDFTNLISAAPETRRRSR